MPIAGASEKWPAILYDNGGAALNAKHPDYGALADNATDDRLKLQAVVDGGAGGRQIVLPKGNYVVSDEIDITATSNNIQIRGESNGGTNIVFKPTATGKRLFKLSAGASQVDRVVISDLMITVHASAAAFQKICFELMDCREVTLRNVYIVGWTGSNGGATDANGMYATPSTGLLIKGREILKLENSIIDADRPIHIAVNPNVATLNCDHMRVDGLYSLCRDPNGAHVFIDPTVLVTTMSFGGFQAWVFGKYGVFRKDADGTATRSYQVRFENIRFEQATAGGYLCYWVGNVSALIFENCYPPIVGNGFYVRYCQSLILNGIVTSNATGVNIDVDSTVTQVSGEGNDWGDSSTNNLGTNVIHLESPHSAAKTLGGTFIIGAAAPFRALALLSPLITTPHIAGFMRFDDAAAVIRGGATSLEVRDVTEAFKNLIISNAGSVIARARLASAIVTVVYAATMNVDAAAGNVFTVTPTNGTAFTFGTPANPSAGQRIRIRVRNTFGALGAVSWVAAFKLGAAWVQPANGFSRSIDFDYDGTNWVEANRSAVDVAN